MSAVPVRCGEEGAEPESEALDLPVHLPSNNRKKRAFKEGDLAKLKHAQGKLKVKLKEARELHPKG